MSRRNLLHRIAVLCLVSAICIGQGCSEMDNPSQDMMDDDKMTLAGRVIDTDRNSVSELALFVEYIIVKPVISYTLL